jgi:hypothetical protein
MENEKMFFYYHSHGFDPEKLTKISNFNDNINILATSKTNNGREFVAIYEHTIYPWIGTQFHPEKVIYEHNEHLKLSKTIDAFNISRKYAEFFYSFIKNKSNKVTFLDNRSVQIMKMFSSTNFNHKNVDEVFEWDYFDYYHRLFGLIRKFNKHFLRLHSEEKNAKKTDIDKNKTIKVG